jgi:hypothetical protein
MGQRSNDVRLMEAIGYGMIRPSFRNHLLRRTVARESEMAGLRGALDVAGFGRSPMT